MISNYFITQELDGLRTLSKYTGSDADVVIPDGIEAIGSQAFANNSSIKSIVIPQSVRSIADSAFAGCTSLTGVNIPSGLTSIGNGLFEGCSSLVSIVIPYSVTSIGYRAFWDCDAFTDVYFGGTEDEWNALIENIGNFNLPLLNATIHYNYIEE